MTLVINAAPKEERYNINQGLSERNPGKIIAMIFHPSNTDFLKIADYPTPLTAIQAALVNADYPKRFYIIKDLISPEKKGEDPAYEKRGQYSFLSDKGVWEMHWTINSAYNDYKKIKRKCKSLKNKLVTLIDEFYGVRHRTVATGMRGFRIHEIEVMPLAEAVNGAIVKYTIRLALKDITDITESDYTDLTFNPTLDLQGVEDAPLVLGASGVAGTFRVSAKALGGELDLMKMYDENTELRQSGAFSFVNNAGLAIGITSVNAVKSGNDTVAFDIVANTGSNYTATQKGYIRWAAPSTIYGYIGMYLDCEDLEVTLT